MISRFIKKHPFSLCVLGKTLFLQKKVKICSFMEQQVLGGGSFQSYWNINNSISSYLGEHRNLRNF